MEPDFQDMAGSDGVSVHTGFPNPALDRRKHAGKLALNLDGLLVPRPNSSYLFRISGHRWAEQGIFDGDIAVIDRALRPRSSSLVLIWEGNNFSLERQHRSQEQPWGVVTTVIHQLERP